MKITIDNRTGMPKIVLEESDLYDISQIEEMINGRFLCRKCGTESENKGWKVLTGYLESEKIKFEKKVYDSLELKQDEGLTRIKMSILSGFNHFMTLPQKIFAQAQRMRDKLKEQEMPNDEPANEYGD